MVKNNFLPCNIQDQLAMTSVVLISKVQPFHTSWLISGELVSNILKFSALAHVAVFTEVGFAPSKQEHFCKSILPFTMSHYA